MTTRYSRYPALADAFRALRLVDRQGVGVPRMYQQMIAEGHRTPVIEQVAGPRVRTTLTGEPLLAPLAALLKDIEPSVRARDVRVAVLVDAALRLPYLTVRRAATSLQSTEAAAEAALAVTEICTVSGKLATTNPPLMIRDGDMWRLHPKVASAVSQGRFGPLPSNDELLWFRGRGNATLRRVVSEWFIDHDRMTSGQLSAITGVAVSNASTALSSMSDLVVRGSAPGRAHFIATIKG
ncbi:MAG: DUF5635 domain-containing protein [Ilumatobacteraceae bacterium]